jgi:ATP-binding cassette subfamily B protein
MNSNNIGRSLKHKLFIIWRGILTVHHLERKIIPVTLASAILTAVFPFINILTTTLIIDEMLGEKSISRLIYYVGMTIGLNLVVLLLIRWLNRLQSVAQYRLYNRARIEISKTILNTDYENLENPELYILKQKIDDARNLGDQGIFRVPLLLGWFMSSLFNVIISIIVIVPLFFHSHLSGEGNRFIASPWFSVVLLVLILLASAFSIVSNSIPAKAMFRGMEQTVPMYRKLTFYSALISNPKFGQDVRLYHLQDLVSAEIRAFGDTAIDFFRRMGKMKGRYAGADAAISSLLNGLMYLCIGLRALEHVISIGAVVKYVGAIRQFTAGVNGLGASITDTWINVGYIKLYLDFLDTPNQKYRGTLPVEKRSDNEYVIEFKNVSFRYPGTDNYALKNLSLRLNIGERLAVVGMNGSGKTTFVKLLCRLYDPQEGEILLNGINIQKYDYKEYLSLFSVVFQDFQLFAFSTGQNVAAAVDYDRQRAMECLNEVGVAERILQMPKGIDTPLYNVDEGGVDISGGEAQKIALARALYKNAPFVVLDEPTAALDPIAEFDIYSKFNSMVGDKTAVYISHRLSSCRFCSNIAVFDKGEMVQFGPHDELVKDDHGKYFALWNAQAKYYKSQ